MQAMIATGRDPVAETPSWVLPTIVRTIIEEPPTPRELPDKIDPPVKPPPTITPTRDSNSGTVRVTVTPPAGPGPVMPRAGHGLADAMPLALVKIAAVYPPRAITRGIEGYVIVQYTVTQTGSVADVVVVESSHAIFEPNAIAAAEQFRYKPRTVGGEAVATAGVLNMFTFTLEN